MRVLQLITQARGGPVDHAVEVAIELVRQGHRSHLAGPSGSHLDAAQAAGVEVHAVDVRAASDLRGIREVARIMRAVRPDVLHLQDRRAGLIGRGLATAQGVGSVYSLHGVPDQLATLVPGNLEIASARRGDRIRYLGLEGMLARAPRSAVVTPCEALADYAREQVGVRRDRVYAVPNGVGPHWLDTASGERVSVATASAELPVTITWLGVMQPVKRVADLVAAVDLVPDAHLELVGDGPERPRIEAAAAAANDPRRVRFTGFSDDPSSALRSSDILALPSAAEAFPMALLQAMACGLPVVATRVGGVAEMVRDGLDGLLIEPGRVDQLAAALTRLTADPGLRRRMGESGRARVRDHFTVHHSVDALLDVYDGVAA